MSNSEPFFIKLKIKREARKITLNEISTKTKININFLDSIEKGNFDVLPKTYIRLFLKSYCIEIGADPIKTINDYDLFMFGKVKPKSEKNLIDSNKNSNKKNYNKTIFNYDIKKIFSICLSILVIYILFDFIGNLNDNIQTNNLNQISDLNSKIINENLESNKDVVLFRKKPLIKDFSEKLFNKSNLSETDNIKLPTSPPFLFNAKAVKDTRIHYRVEENNVSIEDKNFIMQKDTMINIEYNETLFFDILYCNDLEFSLNNIRIDDKINCNQSLFRASIDSTGAVNVNFYSR